PPQTSRATIPRQRFQVSLQVSSWQAPNAIPDHPSTTIRIDRPGAKAPSENNMMLGATNVPVIVPGCGSAIVRLTDNVASGSLNISAGKTKGECAMGFTRSTIGAISLAGALLASTAWVLADAMMPSAGDPLAIANGKISGTRLGSGV